jgi:hypothetical protein
VKYCKECKEKISNMKEYDFSPREEFPKKYGLTGRDGPPGSEMMIRGVPAFLSQSDVSVWPARETPVDKEKLSIGVHYIRKSLTNQGLNLSVPITSGRNMLFQNSVSVSGRTRKKKEFEIPFYNYQDKRAIQFVMGAVCKKAGWIELMFICQLEEC